MFCQKFTVEKKKFHTTERENPRRAESCHSRKTRFPLPPLLFANRSKYKLLQVRCVIEREIFEITTFIFKYK